MSDDYKFYMDEEEIKGAIRLYKQEKLKDIFTDHGVTSIDFSYDRKTSEISAIVVLNKKVDIVFAEEALEAADWTLLEVASLEKGGRISAGQNLVSTRALFEKMPEEATILDGSEEE